MRGLLVCLVLFWGGMASAHASEQSFVLLLPTDVYISAGVASVVLTVLLLAVLPARAGEAVFSPVPLVRRPRWAWRHATSLLATGVLTFAVWQGFAGPRTPMENPMPLLLWTVWWVALVSLQGLFGNHWRWTNPWTGVVAVLARWTGIRPLMRYPRRWGYWPAVGLFLAFAAFLLCDPAPADPARLASVVGLYWYAVLFGVLLFGPAFLLRGEMVTVMMRAYGRMGVLAPVRGSLALGLWGWQGVMRRAPPLALAVLMVLLLGTGSFDGLNETFWWMGVIGVNPLEFPGRSAVVVPNLIGLVVANLGLLTVFAACLWLGERIAGTGRRLRAAFCLFAPSILPIALGYHVAHYLPTFLVEVQYVVQMLDDPLSSGAHFLGMDGFYVTTGFFNTQDTVRRIWLSQAGAVVVGHVVAILMAHALAMRDRADRRRAVLGQAPLAVFMVAYTFFGLWLLASPRG
ncbi:hypothetical protein PVV74_14245 [Roseovarius sp. SK2]|uniref:hypothetical protein n=1 Tax=Roseovarius TaxID=74030 RepID=UPI00237ADBE1|nr:hypothetical protein [Roseovarius sp. SK2]MDD9726624.1 hypothetical protein [Roseovarius sp. SK2]